MSLFTYLPAYIFSFLPIIIFCLMLSNLFELIKLSIKESKSSDKSADYKMFFILVVIELAISINLFIYSFEKDSKLNRYVFRPSSPMFSNVVKVKIVKEYQNGIGVLLFDQGNNFANIQCDLFESTNTCVDKFLKNEKKILAGEPVEQVTVFSE